MLDELEINKSLLKEKMQALQVVKSKLEGVRNEKKAHTIRLKKQKQELSEKSEYVTKIFNNIVLEKKRLIDKLNKSISQKRNEMLADEFVQVEYVFNEQDKDDNNDLTALSDLLNELEITVASFQTEKEGYSQECDEILMLHEKIRNDEDATIKDFNAKIDSLELAAERLDDEIELLYQQLPHNSITDSVSNILHEFAESEVMTQLSHESIAEGDRNTYDENEPLFSSPSRLQHMAASYLRHLDLDISDLMNIAKLQSKPQLSNAGLHEGLQHILTAETSRLHYLRWANIEIMLIKLLQGRISDIDLQRNDVDLESFISPSVLFPSGRAIPVERHATRRRRAVMTAIAEGTEHSMMSLLHMTLYSVLVYQLLLPYLNQEQYSLDGLEHIFKNYEEVGTNSIVRLLAKMRPEMTSGIVIGFMATSVFILAAKQAVSVWHCDNTKADRLIDELDNLSFDVVKNNLSFLFPYRWLPPFSMVPYFNFESKFSLAEHYILHQGDISPEKRLQIWGKLKALALKRNKLVRREAMHTIANIAHGIALKDLLWLHDQGYSNKEQSVHLYIKTDAYGILHYLAGSYQLDNKTGLLNQYIYPFNRYLYANYLLWWLNDTNRLFKHPRLSSFSGLLFLVFKLSKLILQAKLFEIIIKSIIEAIRCPDLPYVQFGKEIPVYANKLTTQCFEQLVKYFRSLPGNERQPVSLITDNLHHFDFWLRDEAGNVITPGLTKLDLSYKFMHAAEVAHLLNSLKSHKSDKDSTNGNGIDLKFLNLSSQGNDVSQADFGSDESFYCLINTERCNFFSDMGALIKTLAAWPSLEVFDFSNNYIDILNSTSSHNFPLLTNGLSQLKKLKTLNLAGNSFGEWVTDSDGISIGTMLRHLTQLKSLDLSSNSLGSQSANLPKAIANSFPYLTSLEDLYLDDNKLEICDVLGTEAIGLNLRYLISLKKLSMSSNSIGALGANGTIAISQSLPFLGNLTNVDFSFNRIGNTSSAGITDIAKFLVDLTNLTEFNMEGNNYFMHLNLSEIQKFSLSTRNLSFIPNFSSNSANDKQLDFLIKSMEPSQLLRVYIFDGTSNPETMRCYLERLPANTETLTPYVFNSLGMRIVNDENLEVLATHLPRFFNLKSLFLYKADEDEGYYFNNTIFTKFLSNLGKLMNIRKLSLQHMSGTDVTLSALNFAKNLAHLKKIVTLEVIAPYGQGDPEAISKIGKSLPLLTDLRDLTFSFCLDADLLLGCDYCHGSDGFAVLNRNIQYATKLRTLQLIGNCLGYNNTAGSLALAESLKKLIYLRSLILEFNHIGYSSSDGIEAIGASLSALSFLENLNLQHNNIGFLNSNGLVAIAKGIASLKQLLYVSLVNNQISSHDNDGLQALSDAIKRSSSNFRIDLAENPAPGLILNFSVDAQQKYVQLNQSCNDQVCHANHIYLSHQKLMMPSSGPRYQISSHIIGNTSNFNGVPDIQFAQQPLIVGLYFYALLKQSNLDSTTAFHITTLFTAIQFSGFPIHFTALISALIYSIFNIVNWATDEKFHQADDVIAIAEPIHYRQQVNGNYLSSCGVFHQKGNALVGSAEIFKEKFHAFSLSKS